MSVRDSQRELPTRTAADLTDDEAVPDGDPVDTVGLLSERLRAWKHMCGYLEGYIEAVSKEQKSNSKDQEKVLKSVSHPLREGHHFDQATGGVASLFENLRSNTSAIANMHLETSKNLDGTVLPMLQRLHQEIKNKDKELEKGAGKGSRAVEKARNESQKYIELLGTHTANFDSAGGRVTSHYDPYILQRGVNHRLNKQMSEENNNRGDLIAVQDNFKQFEAHILSQVQAALNSFQQFMGSQADRQKAIYGDVAQTASQIPPDFEWKGFLRRDQKLLVNPDAPPRTMDNIHFPNKDHRATKPLIEGSLERKSRALGALKGYSAGYYAVTPAGFLHEFKDNDDYRKDPVPEISLYLPDCVIGAVDGTKFTIKGKDTSSGKIGSKLAHSFEYNFKAHTDSDAKMWHDIIASKSSGTSSSVPTSPISNTSSPTADYQSLSVEEKEKLQESGQGPAPGKIDTSVGGQSQQQQGQESGITSGASTSTSTTAQKESTPLTAGSEATHFHGAPAKTELEQRQYVQK